MNVTQPKTATREIIVPDPEPPAVPASVVETDAGSLMAVITKAARDDRTDVDKLERLMGLYERITNRQAEQAFNDAMRAAQAEMPQVVRDADNEQTRSKYSRLETISAAMTPVITKHGFSVSFGTDDAPKPDHYRVTAVVTNGGYSRNYHADIPIDIAGMKGNQNKTATHAFGSTMSYGRRYLLLLIFNVATKIEDDDGNAAGSAAITEEQLATLQTLIDDAQVDVVKVCKFAKVEALADIRAKNFDAIVSAVARFKAKKLSEAKP